ncbi:MAG: hypothetical protein JW885_00220 [Deltaproteobacteria bacterium]|nr:hypothetical protein [Candidatus Zymogenaceae bacterium]
MPVNKTTRAWIEDGKEKEWERRKKRDEGIKRGGNGDGTGENGIRIGRNMKPEVFTIRFHH